MSYSRYTTYLIRGLIEDVDVFKIKPPCLTMLSTKFTVCLIEDVDVFKIKPSKMPLRSQLTGIEQLAESIKEIGLLQPIVVRHCNDDSFEIVAGNRRYTACKLLGRRRMPCHIVELDDKEAFEISLVENVQRKTLNPIEEAEAFRKYVSDFGWGGVSDLAHKIGKSATYVTRRIKLLNLPKEIIRAIEMSVISASVAEEIRSITDESEQSKLGELIARRHLSLREARVLVTNYNADSDISQTMATREVERAQRSFYKAIIALRYCMSQLSAVIPGIEENWIAHEILMQHKNLLHSQIELLLKQKKAYSVRKM